MMKQKMTQKYQSAGASSNGMNLPAGVID